MASRVLLIDDSATIRRLVDALLTPAGHTVIGVATPDEALPRAAQAALIMLDLSLPDTDAYGFAAKLREQAGRKVPIIFLASADKPIEPSQLATLGHAASVVKPFKSDDLLQCVETTAAAAAADPESVPPTEAAPEEAIDSSAPAAPAKSLPPAVPSAAQPPAGGLPAMAPLNLSSSLSTPRQSHLPPGKMPMAGAPLKATQNLPKMAPPLDIAKPAAEAPKPATGGDFAAMGLNAEQEAKVREMIREQVSALVWEVVPDLAETLIKEEIKRLTQQA